MLGQDAGSPSSDVDCRRPTRLCFNAPPQADTLPVSPPGPKSFALGASTRRPGSSEKARLEWLSLLLAARPCGQVTVASVALRARTRPDCQPRPSSPCLLLSPFPWPPGSPCSEYQPPPLSPARTTMFCLRDARFPGAPKVGGKSPGSPPPSQVSRCGDGLTVLARQRPWFTS